jgi:hypothetical protein
MGSPPDVGILREKSWKVALLGSHLFWFELSLPVVWQGLGFRLAFLPQMGFTRGRSVSAVGLSRRNRWREPPLRLEKLCPTYRHTSLTRCRIIAVLKLSSLGRLGPTGRLGFRRSDLVRVWLTSTGRAYAAKWPIHVRSTLGEFVWPRLEVAWSLAKGILGVQRLMRHLISSGSKFESEIGYSRAVVDATGFSCPVRQVLIIGR